MRALRITIAAAGVLALLGPHDPESVPPGAPAISSAVAAQAGRRSFALLIGCTRYPSLPRRLWLDGPANDVGLVHQLLTHERFGFQTPDVTVLSGWPAEVHRRPTRSNIARALARLAAIAGPGDRVVVYLSGHGSQQPADNDPGDPEPDGMDEIFLPADTRSWNQDAGVVDGAITDDELGRWIEPISKKGARVWVIVDACHSGTMTRAPLDGSTRLRWVPPSLLMAPAARPRESGTRGRAPVSSPAGWLDGSSGASLVALYAAQADEATPELRFPRPDGPTYGLLTFTLAQVLLQTSRPLTYRELADAITSRYRGGGYPRPTPVIEGRTLDQPVLDSTAAGDHSFAVLRRVDANSVEIAAGRLHGIGPGSILAVYPRVPRPGATPAVGYVRVRVAHALTSVAEPAAAFGQSAPDIADMGPGAGCWPVLLDLGPLRLRVALQTASGAAGSRNSPGTRTIVPQGSGSRLLENALGIAVKESRGLIERVTTDPDWLVRPQGREIVLVPAADWIETHEGVSGPHGHAPPTFAVRSSRNAAALGAALGADLFRIARAHHLLRIARDQTLAGGRRLDVDVELLRAGGTGAALMPVPFEREGRVLHEGDQVAFRVSNRDGEAVDVTLLLVDAAFGIQCVFPEIGGAGARLLPGRTLTSPQFRVGAPYGAEQVVAIAVRAGAALVDFSMLAQPALRPSRGPLVDSPLGRLLADAMFGGQTRAVGGLSAAHLGEHAMRILAWRTLPAPRASGGKD